MIASASAVYYCNGGGCTGDGGNGDNGTNNGNNSSDNTINVNLGANGAGSASSLAARSQHSGVTVPIQLPSFAAAGCGTRPSVYAGLTGSPGNGEGISNSPSVGFGLGLITPIGKEPDSCKPPVVNYTTYITTPSGASAPVVGSALNAAPAAAPAMIAAANVPATGACVRLDYDVAEFYAHDLKVAKHTYDTVRIERDMRVLEAGCFHSLVISSIEGH